MTRPIRAGLALLLLCLAALPGNAQDRALDPGSTLNGVLERGALRVCFEAGYLPFEMVGKRSGLRERSLRPADERKGGQKTSFGGFDIDLARAMARDLGVDFVPVNTRWTSIIPSLVLGRCDIIISGMSITEERRQRVDFSDPYMQVGQTVLLNGKLADKVTSYRDLNDPKYRVASKPGTTGEAAVKRHLPEAVYQAFDTETAAAAAVAEGKVDAFVYDRPFHATYLAMHGAQGLVFLDEPFTDEAIAFAIRKDDPDFLAWLNAFLQEIRTDGRYDEIRRKWFESTDWFEFYG
ncbi:MAG: transporter substrate-binding domain-containing protein [Kiloniellales bacterium]|nr:transporter substrate-binding domain-containing protein [Kiloniellales bacterium]